MNKFQHIHELKVEKIKRQLEKLREQRGGNDTLRLWFAYGFDDLGLLLDEFEYPENQVLLLNYKHQFNKIFFAGDRSVRNFKVRMIMAEGNTGEWKEKYPTRLGETTIGTGDDPKVEIDILQEMQKTDHQEQLKQYLSVLLHEMLHGFMDNKPCPCAECAKGTSLSAGGLTGHGLPFMEALKAMEQFCHEVLHLPLDLNRHVSMAQELGEGGLSSKDVDLVALGLNGDVIDRFVSIESKNSGSQTSS